MALNTIARSLNVDARPLSRVVWLLFVCALAASGCEIEAAPSEESALDAGVAFAPSSDAGEPQSESDQGAADMRASSDAAAPVADEGTPQVMFDLEAALGGEFYDFPYPSDLRTDERGHPILDHFPMSRNPWFETVVAILQEARPGFSPLTTTYLRLSAPLDESNFYRSLDPLDEQAPVLLIDIDPDSPSRGERLPLAVEFHQERGPFWRENTLTARPIPGVHMREGRRYAMVWRAEALAGTDGRAARPAPEWTRMIEARASPSTEIERHYAELLDAVEEAGVAPESLIAATSITTARPTEELEWLLRDADEVSLETLPMWSRGEGRLWLAHLPRELPDPGVLLGRPPVLDLWRGALRVR